jgi:hypothetical protein
MSPEELTGSIGRDVAVARRAAEEAAATSRAASLDVSAVRTRCVELETRVEAVERVASDVAFLRTAELDRQRRELDAEQAARATSRARTRNLALAIPVATALIGAAAALGVAVVQGPMTATARAQSAEVASQRLDEQLDRERALLDEHSARQQREWSTRITELRSEWRREQLDAAKLADSRAPSP